MILLLKRGVVIFGIINIFSNHVYQIFIYLLFICLTTLQDLKKSSP